MSVLSINPDATFGGVRFVLLQPVHEQVTVHGTFCTFFTEFESCLYIHHFLCSTLSTAGFFFGGFFFSPFFTLEGLHSQSFLNLLPPPLALSSCVCCPPFVSAVAVGSKPESAGTVWLR